MDRQNEAPSTPDFLALGLGGTNMMAMLWTIAMGRRAVGVEMRGDPFLGVHWNIREDLYHQLGLIDQLMLERYGEARLPRRGDGRLFRLAECFYSPETTAGDIVADEIIDGFDADQHIVGTIHNVEFIDDRWRDGLPNRVITVLDPPRPPQEPDPRKIRTSMLDVLDGPSTFQAEAASIQKLLRRYLELIEQKDLETKDEPRVQLYTHHRVVPGKDDGFINSPDGRKQIRIEALKEFDFKGQFVRIREPNSEIIDLGVPELFMIAQGFSSTDARRLGFEQHDVKVDHRDGRGEVVAQADFMAGLVEVLVGGRLRRRISSAFDQDGKEYWVRQIAVGHENDPEVGWVLVQVPDFKTFDPVAAGLLPEGTNPDSPEFFASYQQLIYDDYMKQAAEILDIPRDELKKVQMIYGPTLFSLVERTGDDALVAPNGVVAGDSFGNGHFLTSGGAMTGMIGHSARVLEYWQARDAGTAPTKAIRKLADQIKEDTNAWLEVSAKEYSQAAPINFGAERIEQISKASGIESSARANAIDAARRQRHALIPLDPSNWRRLFVRNGRVLSALPELGDNHPLQRPEHAASLLVMMQSLPVMPDKITVSPDKEPLLVDADQTVIRSRPNKLQEQIEAEKTLLRIRGSANQMLAEASQTQLKPKVSISPVAPESAKIYAFLDIQQAENKLQRIPIKEETLIVGRVDRSNGVTPAIDLTPFDTGTTVSRQHARIRMNQDRFYLEDLNSRNKTRLGGMTLTPNQPEVLRNGDLLRFGSVKAVFRLLGTSELPVSWSPSW
ncbi:MAG TPA: FHA domain-containing protein [Ktedonobacteraceae bacterium]|nr:FHA domain-containing protein [Ktedonobacteraceae bacterium]